MGIEASACASVSALLCCLLCFLQRDDYASAAYVVMRFLSVCLSVTFVNFVKMNKYIINFLTLW